MKKILASLILCAVLVGCTSTSQRTAYNTIASVEQIATVTVDDYYTLVLQGRLSTNGVPAVSKAFNSLQAAAALAATASKAGTNALASDSLILEASQLGVLINAVKTQK